MKPSRTLLIPLAVAGTLLAGCGGDQESPTPAADAAGTPEATETAAAESMPAALTEVAWETTTTGADITDRDMAADLRPRNEWRLEFHETGGIDGGPSVTLDNNRYGTIASPVSVSGDRLRVVYGPPCEGFRWRIRGDRLTLTPRGGNCPSTSQSSIFASTWKAAR